MPSEGVFGLKEDLVENHFSNLLGRNKGFILIRFRTRNSRRFAWHEWGVGDRGGITILTVTILIY